MENDYTEFLTISSSDFILGDFTPNYTIQFIKDKVTIGTFDFSKLPATFVGDVDESAKIFCDTVIKWMPQIIEKYK